MFFPLKKNADVRAGTCSPGIFARTLRSSSLIPSEKYSPSLPGLKSANASTATDLLLAVETIVVGGSAGAVDWAGAGAALAITVTGFERHCHTATAVAIAV